MIKVGEKFGNFESIRIEMEQGGIRLKAPINERPLEETFTLLTRNGREPRNCFGADS